MWKKIGLSKAYLRWIRTSVLFAASSWSWGVEAPSSITMVIILGALKKTPYHHFEKYLNYGSNMSRNYNYI
jgi:hypothetical protein